MTAKTRILLGRYLRPAIALSDTIAISAAYFLTMLLLAPAQNSVWLSHTVQILMLTAWVPACMLMLSRSEFRATRMERWIGESFRAIILHALIFITLLYITETPGIAPLTLLEFYLIASVTLPSERAIARIIIKQMRSAGRNKNRVVIVGANDTAARLCQELVADPGFGYKMMGVFAEQPGPAIDPCLYRGDLGDLDEFVRENAIDEIYCTLNADQEELLQTAVSVADNYNARYYYVPQISRNMTRGFDMEQIGYVTVMGNCRAPLSNPLNRIIKRAVDITVGSVAALLFPIVFIPVAIAIKINSPGPVFYRQRRTGIRGRDFQCLKFRTMQYEPADEAPVEKNDPRVTSVGRFLRHSSLDELPQIFNVLSGDMSIVGPRPHMTSHTVYYSQIVDKYMLRHAVKPGITGWAQSNGLRGSTDQLWKMERRVEHDVWYIEHWSFLLDIKIIARTFLNIIRGDENAY